MKVDPLKLQIGNLIRHKNYGIFQIEVIARDWEAVHFKSIDEKRQFMYLKEKFVEGIPTMPDVREGWSYIPLTKEWLERFGFSQVKDTTWALHLSPFILRVATVYGEPIYQYKPCWNVWLVLPSGSAYTSITLMYVHELQNLYKLLGKELTFKM